jgi:hypothetical protein
MKVTYIYYVSLLVMTLCSCREDVIVFAPQEFVPVVYCLLNPVEEEQSVRVSRVFQDKRSQAEWQNQFDEYLADTLNRIYIEAIDPAGNRLITCFKWKETIHSASDTVFARSDLYTAKMNPDYGSVYQLYVYFPETRQIASAKIKTLTRIQIVDPAKVPGRKLVIAPSQPYVLRWYGTEESVYFQGIVGLNYLEEEGGQIVAKSIKMELLPVFQYFNNELITQNISGIHFLKTLKDHIPEKPGVRRKMTDLDFTFYYGGIELALFANSGLNPKGPEGTVADFTNLDNGRGLFSSISSIRVTGIQLAPQTHDTIALHELTRNLNFLRSYEDFH